MTQNRPAAIATDRKQHLEQFYGLLAELERKIGALRTLSACNGRMGWPLRGVYFFQEQGEQRSDTGSGQRIVRVGTHALTTSSGTKLWSRLSQHQGTQKTGGGNHRGSIFRLIVGTALIKRDSHEYPTWGSGSSASREICSVEVPLEQAVSKVIGAMPFLWLAINDEPGPDSLRGYIERNSIALLSNHDKEPLDPPTAGWLGHLCNRERVRSSDLWNQNHVEEEYDPAFLETLEQLIHKMEETS
ncbi:MAG: hypothetical protein ACR2P9_06560 [Gammaproteobacteria bacterium]